MQSNICRILGACSLAITFSAAGQTAGGAAAGGGGTAAAGTSAGTARAATTTTARPAAPASGPRIATGGNATTATTASGAPGQSVSGAAGQSVTATPAQTTTTTTTGGTLPGQNPAGAIAGTTPAGTATATTPGAAASAAGNANVSTPVAFTTLPANVQSQIANQVPPGAQLAQVVQEISPQGAVSYRAQVMQNGTLREIPLAGQINGQNLVRSGTLSGAVGTTVDASGTASGLVVGTPVAYGAIPAPIQTALTTQSAGQPLSNLTFTPGVNGNGLYRGMVNGRPIEVRVGPNGQILPSTTQLAATATTVSTNDLKIDDLPEAVRNSIKTTAPDSEVTQIRRVDGTSGDLFDVTLRGNGEETKLRLSENGTVVQDQDTAVAIATPSPALTNQPPKIAFNTLPESVRTAIVTRTDEKSIRSMFLTNYNGKTTYAVDYLDKEALRHRLFVAKDGLVVGVATNLYGIKQTAELIVVADLPAPARATIEQQAGGKVMRVNTATRGDAPVYVVSYLKDGVMQQMIVAATGERIDAVGGPAASEIGVENK